MFKDLKNLFNNSGDDLRGMWRLFRGASFPPAGPSVLLAPQQDGNPHPFAPHYQHHIQPLVNEFEQKRLNYIEALHGCTKIAFPIFIGLVVVTLVGEVATVSYLPKGIGTGIGLLIFATVSGYWWLSGPIRDYSNAVKGKVHPLIFSYFGQEFEYNVLGQFSMDRLKSSGIIPSYDRETSEDHVRGSYKGVLLNLQETHLEKKRRSKNRTYWDTVFRGIIIELEMNKPFSGHTIVQRDFGRIGNFFAAKFGKSSDMQKVALEDPEFESKFEVFSTDQVEARYLLTTSFMERLLKLARLFADPHLLKAAEKYPEDAHKFGAKLQASFYQNKLLLMIDSSHNRFEVASIFEPCTFENEIQTILEEMKQIFGIIDTLKLDQQTHL